MPSLKDLKLRIESVKSTRKITSAMKMVAAAKLRRAQAQAEASRPYAAAMARLLARLGTSAQAAGESLSPLLAGTGKDDTVLLLVITADRGLAGMFNGAAVREARVQARALQAAGKTVKFFCVGRKGRELLNREFPGAVIGSVEELGRNAPGKRIAYTDAAGVQAQLLTLFDAGEFDRCLLVYNRFQSAMTQIPTTTQIIPAALPQAANENTVDSQTSDIQTPRAIYEFEPDAAEILASLLPKSLGMQIYGALLESQAGFFGAQMTAMDSATRNAGDMINRLTLTYNRTRQAYITKELIEIISGAEAV